MKRYLFALLTAAALSGCTTAREKAFQAELEYYQAGAAEYRRALFERSRQAVERAGRAHAEGRPMDAATRRELVETGAELHAMEQRQQAYDAQMQRDLDRAAIQRQAAALEAIATEDLRRW